MIHERQIGMNGAIGHERRRGMNGTIGHERQRRIKGAEMGHDNTTTNQILINILDNPLA